MDLHARLDPSRCIAVLDRVVRERLGEEDAGVIDQYVDRLEARPRRLDDPGGSCRLADVAVHQGDVVGSRDLSGLGHLPGIGNDVEPPFDKPLHDSRGRSPAKPQSRWLSSVGHSWLFTSKTSTVIWLLRKRFERKLIAPWLVKRQGRFSG